MLAKEAMESIPPANSESGFCNRYFLVPKKDGGLRPILDLRHLNRSLSPNLVNRLPGDSVNFNPNYMLYRGNVARPVQMIWSVF